MAKADPAIDMTPPKAVQKACAHGLAIRDEYGGAGLRAPTVAKAKHFAAGKANDPAHARKMRAWFARHKVDRRPGWDKPPTPGFVAHQLWGGDAGERWVNALVARLEAHKQAAKPAAKAGEGAKKKVAKAAPAGKKKPAKARAGRKKTAAKKA